MAFRSRAAPSAVRSDGVVPTWPDCVPSLAGFERVKSLPGLPDDLQILRDAMVRIAKCRPKLANELFAGVRACRGDTVERAAWRSLVGKKTDDTHTQTPEETPPAGLCGDPSEAEMIDSGTAKSSDPYSRLASSQLNNGAYSLNPSVEWRAANDACAATETQTGLPETELTAGDGKTQRRHATPPTTSATRGGDASAVQETVFETSVNVTSCLFRVANLPGTVQHVCFVAGADSVSSSAGPYAQHVAVTTVTRTFLETSLFRVVCADDDGRVVSNEITKLKVRLKPDTHAPHSSCLFSVVRPDDGISTFLALPFCCLNHDFPRPATSDGARHGARVFAVDHPGTAFDFQSGFAVTRLAASADGTWLVGAGAGGRIVAWCAKQVLCHPGYDGKEGEGDEEFHRQLVTEERRVGVELPISRYAGVAPLGDAPTALRFSDDGETLTVVFDETTFVTYKVPPVELMPEIVHGKARNTSYDTSGLARWSLSGVSYSTKNRVQSMRAFDASTSADAKNGFVFQDADAKTMPTALVALASRKSEGHGLADTGNNTPRVVVGVLDHTADRGEAPRGLVVGDCVAFDLSSLTEKNEKNEFVPVALGGAAGGYAIVVGAKGQAFVWDVVTGVTLGKWVVRAGGGWDIFSSLSAHTENTASVALTLAASDSILACVATAISSEDGTKDSTFFEVHRFLLGSHSAGVVINTDNGFQGKRRRTR